MVHLFLDPRGCVRRGLFQFRAQAGRRVGRGLFQLGSQLRGRGARRLFHVATNLVANLLADALGRLGRSLLGVAAYAVGLGDDTAVGVGSRIGEASGETGLPFLADRFNFFTVTIGGLRRRLIEAFNL